MPSQDYWFLSGNLNLWTATDIARKNCTIIASSSQSSGSSFTLMQISFYSSDIRSDILPQTLYIFPLVAQNTGKKTILSRLWLESSKEFRDKWLTHMNSPENYSSLFSNISFVYFSIEWECLFISISNKQKPTANYKDGDIWSGC